MTGSEIKKQGPILPSAGSAEAVNKSDVLPPGVDSLEQWGKTICTLPKVASRRCTYQKLIDEAGRVGDTKVYLAWVHCNAHKSAKAADFKNYMEAVNYDPCKTVGVNYPGTSAIREFGE